MTDARTTDGTLAVGHRLDDYRIEAVLGQGSFGITYKAFDERLERRVAIKEYLPRQFATREADDSVRARSDADAATFDWGLKRFIDEARVLARFKHPNIVAVIRYLEAHGTAYLVMEYEEGRDFERWLVGRAEPPQEAVLVQRILVPLLDGLAKIHAEGLMHRDIKPDNIFIRNDGSPVLIDFGASREQTTGSAPMTSIVSAGYSPFEQYGTGEGQGPWTDLYALAGTMYRAVTGRAPTDAISRYQGASLEPAAVAAAGSYSATLLEAIDRALALDPERRPRSAAEFGRLIGAGVEPVAVDRPEAATHVRTADERAAVVPKRRRWLSVALVLIATGLVAAGAYRYRAHWLTVETAEPLAQQVSEAQTGVGPAVAAPVIEPTLTQSPPVAAPSEDDLVAGWQLSDAERAYRASQIGGALLAYVSNRQKFDDCMATACTDQVALMGKVQEALDGYAWRQGRLVGNLRIANPRKLGRDDCAFVLDLIEAIGDGAATRTQTRTYCTANGFDRALQRSGPIADGPFVAVERRD